MLALIEIELKVDYLIIQQFHSEFGDYFVEWGRKDTHAIGSGEGLVYLEKVISSYKAGQNHEKILSSYVVTRSKFESRTFKVQVYRKYGKVDWTVCSCRKCHNPPFYIKNKFL
jgi:hypothetical protein